MSQRYAPDELVIFVAYASDAQAQAHAIRELTPDVQELLVHHNETANYNYRVARIYTWEMDCTPRVGGQQNINPHLDRANIGVFVLRSRIGAVSYEELQRFVERMPLTHVIALFPSKPPTEVDLTIPSAAEDWAQLMRMRTEISSNWNTSDSTAVVPQEGYSDESSLKEIALGQIKRCLKDLLKVQDAVPASRGEELHQPPATFASPFIDTLSTIRNVGGDFVRAYRNELPRATGSLSDTEFLNREGFMRDGQLTIAGCLLFVRCPVPGVLPTARVQCFVYGKDGRAAQPKERAVLDGTVVDQLQKSYKFVLANVTGTETLNESAVKSAIRYDYSTIAVREVVANSLCHRDYSDYTRIIEVGVFADRIEIRSPGKWKGDTLLGEETDLSALVSGTVQPNSTLARALAEIRMVEGAGTGLSKSIQDCQRINAPIPKVKTQDGYVVVTLFPRLQTENAETLIRSGKPTANEQLGKVVGVLTTFSWDRAGRIFAVREGKNYIGRGSHVYDGWERECEIKVFPDDTSLSAAHAVVLVQKEQAYLMDLVSTNGTWLNGRPIKPSSAEELYDGSTIRTGQTDWVFRTIPPPKAAD